MTHAYNEMLDRRDDDSTNCSIIMTVVPTGGIQLRIHDWDTYEEMMVCFRDYVSGGRSPHVLEAMRNLVVAVQKDNKEHPIERWEKTPAGKHEQRVLVINEMRRKRGKYPRR